MDINNLKKLFNFWQFFPIRNTIKLATTYSIYLKGNRFSEIYLRILKNFNTIYGFRVKYFSKILIRR